MADLHPLIDELFKLLPADGERWPNDKRIAWMIAAKAIFVLIYDYPSDEASP